MVLTNYGANELAYAQDIRDNSSGWIIYYRLDTSQSGADRTKTLYKWYKFNSFW